MTIATTGTSVPVLACSPDEVVWTLLRAGFIVVQRATAAVILERGLRVVAVPTMTTMIAPEALVVMLRDAGLAYSRFLELVGEAPTDVDDVSPSRRFCLSG
jgi:hypothetical protein